jgi:hypothetical protein
MNDGMETRKRCEGERNKTAAERLSSTWYSTTPSRRTWSSMGFDDKVSSNIGLAGIIRLRVVEHNKAQQQGRIVRIPKEKIVTSCLSTRCDAEVDILSNIWCGRFRRQDAAEHTSITSLTTRGRRTHDMANLDD